MKAGASGRIADLGACCVCDAELDRCQLSESMELYLEFKCKG